MKKKYFFVLSNVLAMFLFACEKSEIETPITTNDIVKPAPPEVTSIEKQFNITDPYFYTGLFNGVRITYQTDGRNFVQSFSVAKTSSHGGNTGMFSGFSSHFMLSIWHEHGFYGVPSSNELFRLNHLYTARSFTGDPNDTLHYTIRYTIDDEYYRSDNIANFQATFKIDSFLPKVNRSEPKRDISKRIRASLDSLYLRGPDTILITDLILQSPVQ